MVRDDLPVTIADVVAAARRTSAAVRTPLVAPEHLASRVGVPLYLKLENFQRSGAFKFRGALNCVLNLDAEQRKRGLVAASSGNHGLGMALACSMCKTKATVVMPETAPSVKRSRARYYGAEVYLYGSTYDDAKDFAVSLARELGALYIPSFDHPDVIAGQGVIGLEIIEDLPDLATVIAPIGGGGLVAGLLIALKTLVPSVRVVGVQAKGAAATIESIRQGQPIQLDSVSTIADGIAVAMPGEVTYPVIATLLDDTAMVSDEEILAGMALLAEEARVIAEPAGAASVAAVLAGKAGRLQHPTVCIVSGGNTDCSVIQMALKSEITFSGLRPGQTGDRVSPRSENW